MADYSNDQLGAYNDLKEAGLAVTLRTLETLQSAADSAQPWDGNKSKSSLARDAFTFGVFVVLKKSDIDGTRVKKGDRGILLPGLDNDLAATISPSLDDQLIAGDVTYSIVEIMQTVAFNEQEILHKVALRS